MSCSIESMRGCVILVPVATAIHPQCEAALQQLERRGFEVRRVYGFAAIDQARNRMASDAIQDGFRSTMWIDSDVGFDPTDVEKLINHRLPIVSGLYVQKGKRRLASHVLDGQREIVFGELGGLQEIRYAAAGFMFVDCAVYRTVAEKHALPKCNERFGRHLTPFFLPLVIEDSQQHWYLAEDFAFCERARSCGLSIFADTSVRLLHFGTYGFSWEDAGSPLQRYSSYTFTLE